MGERRLVRSQSSDSRLTSFVFVDANGDRPGSVNEQEQRVQCAEGFVVVVAGVLLNALLGGFLLSMLRPEKGDGVVNSFEFEAFEEGAVFGADVDFNAGAGGHDDAERVSALWAGAVGGASQ